MSKADAGKEADKKKFDPRLVPTFLQKTYALVDSKDSREIVSWGAEPNTFVIFDPNRFAREVLPQYFKQNKMSSFVRQVLPAHPAQHVRLPQENLARQPPPRLLPPALPKGPGAPARQNQAQEELEEEQQGLHFPRPERQRQAEAQPLPRRRTPRSPSTGTPRSTWSSSNKKLRSSSKTTARCSTPVASSRCASTRLSSFLSTSKDYRDRMDQIVLWMVELHSKNKGPARPGDEILEDDQALPEPTKVNYSLVEGGKNLQKKNYVYPQHLTDSLRGLKQGQFGSSAFPGDLEKLLGAGSQRALFEMIDKGGLQAREPRAASGGYFQIQAHKPIQEGHPELPDEPLLIDGLGKRASYEGQYSPLEHGLPSKRHALESNSLLLHSPDMQHLQLNSRVSSPSNSVSGFKLHPSRKNSDLDDMNHEMKLGKQKSFEDLSLSGL